MNAQTWPWAASPPSSGWPWPHSSTSQSGGLWGDYPVMHGLPDSLRKAASEIATEEGWPKDWINDGVKIFMSANEKMHLMVNFDGSDSGGLRIYTAAPEYLFAMKCMAMRPKGIEGAPDISDIEALADKANIKDAENALSLVESFYPASRIPAKIRSRVEEIMAKVIERRAAEMQERE